MRQLPSVLAAAGLTPAYPGRLILSLLAFGPGRGLSQGALAGHVCSAADLRDPAVEELRIIT